MKVRVGDVMTRRVVTISAEAPLKEAAVEMTRHRVSGLPVVEDDRVVGMITESDFVSRLAGDQRGFLSLLFGRRPAELTGVVSEVMSPEPLTIDPDAQLGAAARVMAERKVKRLPVVTGDGRLVGIVSRADLMGVFARHDAEIAADVIRDGVEGLLGTERDSVSVRVEHGVVYLRGTVASMTDKRMLEEFARQVAGVVAVESHLEAAFDETRLPPM